MLRDAWYKFRVWNNLNTPYSAMAMTMELEGYSDLEIAIEEHHWRKSDMSDMKSLLLEAPDTQLDAQMKPLIEKWDEVPKAIQILEVLDQCIYGSLASGFTVSVLQTLYHQALQREKLKSEDVEAQASWRKAY